MTWTPERMLPVRFHVDTNRINGRGNLEHMNRLTAWEDSGLIEIQLSQPAYNESIVGHDLRRVKKANSILQTLTEISNQEERDELSRIERILFPEGARDDNQRNDVEIVFNANKYGGRLVTADGGSKRQPGGILGAKKSLAKLGIYVMTDEEACALVENEIKRRDRIAIQWAEARGIEPPPWVGTDK